MKAIEDKTGIKRQTLCKMLSDNGNPGWVSMNTVLDELGISIEFKYQSSKRKRAGKSGKTEKPLSHKKPIAKKTVAAKKQVRVG